MAAMFGWLSAASSCASRWKRASRSGSRRNVARQHLDGDVASEGRVGGAIDLAHATRADGRRHAVVRQGLPDDARHRILLTLRVSARRGAGEPVVHRETTLRLGANGRGVDYSGSIHTARASLQWRASCRLVPLAAAVAARSHSPWPWQPPSSRSPWRSRRRKPACRQARSPCRPGSRSHWSRVRRW